MAQFTDFADLMANHIDKSGSDMIISAGAITITLKDVSLIDLDPADFVF